MKGVLGSIAFFASVFPLISAQGFKDSIHGWPRPLMRTLKSPLRGRSLNQTTCSPNAAPPAIAPKTNVWGGLTDIETASVIAWLFAQPELNLTVSENATDWSNTVLLVELQQPNKTNALSYIDGNGTEPTRFAHVVLSNSTTTDAHIADILVGPLPIDNGTAAWQPLEYPFTRKTSGRIRNLDADLAALAEAWLIPIGASISDITLDLWNGTMQGLPNDTLALGGINPYWQDDGRVIRWDSFWQIPQDTYDSLSLQPLGLYFKSDITGRDPSQWKLEGWFYNGIFYETTEAFRDAYWSPGFVKLKANAQGDWLSTDQSGPIPKSDTQPPPEQTTSGSPRFAVDPKAKYAEWMDFSFYVGFSRDTGLSLYDIRYKGERLIYEIGLQEALAHYAGNDPYQSGVAYLDTYGGFGPYAFELVPGYDCPGTATYLNSSFYASEETHIHPNSICLFEFEADYPIQRHSSDHYVSVTKNVIFKVRSVSTIGNYDYMTTYSFYLDGTMGVEVRASGYIQSAYYAHNEDYGWKIHDALSGSMHDHVLNFKVDMDIGGIDNSLQLVNLVPTTEVYPWSGGQARNTMKLKRSLVATESDSRMNFDGNTQYIVVNQDAPNDFGEFRGYRVLPSGGVNHLTIINSSNLKESGRWAEYDLQVTQQHDTEPRSAHPYASDDTENPPINFNKFFNGESLNQTDLVLWLNLGMHHIPHTGDLPNTIFTTAQSEVKFVPNNYFVKDESRKTVNQVRVDYQVGNGTTSVELFGQGSQTCVNDLWAYTGDVAVKKFPYTPMEGS